VNVKPGHETAVAASSPPSIKVVTPAEQGLAGSARADPVIINDKTSAAIEMTFIEGPP
jgi:hypothetical protein